MTEIRHTESVVRRTDRTASAAAGNVPDPSRRAFVRNIALAGGGASLAVLLAGCAGNDAAESTDDAAIEPFSIPASEVPVGSGIVLRDREVVVTQPVAGEYFAFGAICTHQGCILSAVEDRGAFCACHSSYFDTSTGNPVAGPAQEPLPSIPMTVSGDTLTIG